MPSADCTVHSSDRQFVHRPINLYTIYGSLDCTSHQSKQPATKVIDRLCRTDGCLCVGCSHQRLFAQAVCRLLDFYFLLILGLGLGSVIGLGFRVRVRDR